MLELLIATYGSILWLVFKKFKLVPINQWTVVTSILIGLAGLLFLGVIFNYNLPVSKDARIYAYMTPVVPQVRGRVIEVPVQPNVPLKQGDVLFKIDPSPYRNKLDALDAKLTLAKKLLRDERSLLKQGAGKRDDMERYLRDVNQLSAQVADAKFNLDSTVVTAPTDGFVTQLLLKRGVMAVPLPFAPVMTFVHSDKPIFGASFNQQVLQVIEEGNDVEIAFTAIPGSIFKGRVKSILPAMAEGQLQASGKLISFAQPRRPGRFPVVIEIVDDMSDYNLPIGSTARVAILTNHQKWLHIIRRIIIRINSWENYLFIP